MSTEDQEVQIGKDVLDCARDGIVAHEKKVEAARVATLKQTPIDALLQAVANAHAEREKLIALVRDYRAFAADLTEVARRPRITFEQRDELAKRATDLVGGDREN